MRVLRFKGLWLKGLTGFSGHPGRHWVSVITYHLEIRCAGCAFYTCWNFIMADPGVTCV